RRIQFGEIVGDADWSGALWNLNHGRHLLQLLIIECGIGRAKIDQVGLQLLNASTTADRLIVDLYLRMSASKRFYPLRHYRVNKCAAGAGDGVGIVCISNLHCSRKVRGRNCRTSE